MVREQMLHNFAARCPKGHRPSQTRTIDELRDSAVLFYCGLCDGHWAPSTEERLRALGFAESSEEWTTSRHPAA